MIFSTINPTKAQQEENRSFKLYGGVEQNVPRTPEEVTAYLIKMKAIMKEYDTLSTQLMMALVSGNKSSQLAESARNEWIRLAIKIDNTIPPAELNQSHKQLADSLRRTNSFLTTLHGYNASQKQDILLALTPVVSDLAGAALSYSTGVSTVISYYKLDPSLNPLGIDGSINPGNLGGLGNFGNLGGSGLDLKNIDIKKLNF